jgi:hypothetical protein
MIAKARVPALAWLAAAAALLSAAGCFHEEQLRVDFSETPRDYLPADYDHVYQRWTRHQTSWHDVQIALEAWATFKSWDFREAYIERYASIYGLSEADRAALRRAQLEAARQSFEFNVTTLSAQWAWNDLEKSSSAWRVTLVDALGHEISPDEIRIEKLPDAYESQFFPVKDEFKRAFQKTYRIRFSVPTSGEFAGPKSGAITLRIVSPIGHLDLTWQA